MQTLTLTSIAVPRVVDSANRVWRSLKQAWPVSSDRPARDRRAEAADVRAWAYQFQHSDPGFASDLFAAADRHELLDDDAR